MDKPNFFEWVEKTMEITGCDFNTAAREYHAIFDNDYDPDDYDNDDNY